MSKQYYDVEVFWKKSAFVRMYAANKKEAREKAKKFSPEKNSTCKKYLNVLDGEGYIKGSWQVGKEIIPKGRDNQDWSDYDESIRTVDSQIVHCKKHSK